VVSKDKTTLYKMQGISADDYVCAITFDLTIDDVIKSKFITMLSIDLANEMAVKLVEVNMGFSPEQENEVPAELTPEKVDAVGEVQNIIMGSAATALSNLLSSKVTITTPKVSIAKASNISFKELEPSISVKIQYVEGIHGSSVLVLKQNDVQLMVNQILGRPLVISDDFEFDEMNISAVCEIMNQMMGAAATTLSELINKVVDISTPEAKIVENDSDVLRVNEVEADDTVCSISFDLNIDGIMQSRFVTLLTISLANELADSMLEQYSASLENYSADNIPDEPVSDGIMNQNEINKMLAAAQTEAAPAPATKPAPKPMEKPVPKPAPKPVAKPTPKPEPKQKTQEYQMNSFDEETEQFLTSKQYNNLRSILNVPMEVSIRIGSTQKRMDEVVEFTKGTIIELDTMANEPVDVVVNGNLIAKGDVVVVDDNFAIRITEIINSNILDTL
jgi:flagellar motor switch protein FliN/FliY